MLSLIIVIKKIKHKVSKNYKTPIIIFSIEINIFNIMQIYFYKIYINKKSNKNKI